MFQKLFTGATKPGLDWIQYLGPTFGQTQALYIDVSTVDAGFLSLPIYLTSIGGESHHVETTGATSIYMPSYKGFRIYLRWSDGRTITPKNALDYKWHINWLGIETIGAPPPVHSSHGTPADTVEHG